MEIVEASQMARIPRNLGGTWARGAGPLLPRMSPTWGQFTARGRSGSHTVSIGCNYSIICKYN